VKIRRAQAFAVVAAPRRGKAAPSILSHFDFAQDAGRPAFGISST